MAEAMGQGLDLAVGELALAADEGGPLAAPLAHPRVEEVVGEVERLGRIEGHRSQADLRPRQTIPHDEDGQPRDRRDERRAKPRRPPGGDEDREDDEPPQDGARRAERAAEGQRRRARPVPLAPEADVDDEDERPDEERTEKGDAQEPGVGGVGPEPANDDRHREPHAREEERVARRAPRVDASQRLGDVAGPGQREERPRHEVEVRVGGGEGGGEHDEVHDRRRPRDAALPEDGHERALPDPDLPPGREREEHDGGGEVDRGEAEDHAEDRARDRALGVSGFSGGHRHDLHPDERVDHEAAGQPHAAEAEGQRVGAQVGHARPRRAR